MTNQRSGEGNGMRRPLVKICGITNVVDAQQAIAAGADFIGLIFAPGSVRTANVTDAKSIFDAVGAEKLVGVFQNQSVDEIETIRASVPFKYVQLHGDEPLDMVQRFEHCIKAITVNDREDLPKVAEYADGPAEYILIDRPKKQTGCRDSSSLAIVQTICMLQELQPPIQTPFFLAGGLALGNIREVMHLMDHSQFVGVDVASGVEERRGIKDHELVRLFIEEAKSNAIPR